MASKRKCANCRKEKKDVKEIEVFDRRDKKNKTVELCGECRKMIKPTPVVWE